MVPSANNQTSGKFFCELGSTSSISESTAGTSFAPLEDHNVRDLPTSSSRNYGSESEESDVENRIELLAAFICPNIGDPMNIKLAFLKQHPIQPTAKDLNGKKVPFDESRVYYRQMSNGLKIQRKWLSYLADTEKIFCSVCMAFGDGKNCDSPFTKDGFSARDTQHLYKALDKHENSKAHNLAAQAANQNRCGKDIASMIDIDLTRKLRNEVENNRRVVERLIDIILFIGKQGLAYRGKKEAAYSLKVESVNHGNFLELVLLLAKYDRILQVHLEKCIRESEKKHAAQKTGRGDFTTFMSNHFINKLIKAVGEIGQGRILKELQEAQIFSIMVDSTQDVSVMDQLAVCVRYAIHGRVNERLLELGVLTDSDGESLFNLIKEKISNCGLSFENIVGCSFDGAANMKGKYNGLQAKMRKVNENLIYTHCMGHVLNLVIGDSTATCRTAENLFGLVEESAVFISQSYKRTTVWTNEAKKEHVVHAKLRRLKKIGATRWWSKHKALSAIIDFNEHEKKFVKFTTFLNVLSAITKGNFNPKTKFLANVLLEKWTKLDTILISCILLDLFEITSPVSEFLQRKELDYLKAWTGVETLLKQIEKNNNEECFDKVLEKCQKFIERVQEVLDDGSTNIILESNFSVSKRVPIKRRNFDEKAEDEARNMSPKQKFRIDYFEILNTATQSIKERFLQNEELLKDCSWFSSQKLDEISLLKVEIPTDALNAISTLAKIDRDELAVELRQFAEQYKNFLGLENECPCPCPNFEQSESDDSEEEEVSNNAHRPTSRGIEKKACACIICIFFELNKLAEDGMFVNLYIAYKYIVTLPCTQVTCERCFSKLKILKSRLRSLLSQSNLAPLLLMFVENDLFIDIDKNLIIDRVANTSDELRRKLLC